MRLLLQTILFFAEYDEKEQGLAYRETVEHSGNSTVQVMLMDTTTDINSIRDSFKDMGCLSEKLNDRYFAMEIPADRVMQNHVLRKIIGTTDRKLSTTGSLPTDRQRNDH